MDRNLHNPEAYSKVSQTSKMKLCAKIINGFQPLTIFIKGSIIDAWLISKYASLKLSKNFRFLSYLVFDLCCQKHSYLVAFYDEKRNSTGNSLEDIFFTTLNVLLCRVIISEVRSFTTQNFQQLLLLLLDYFKGTFSGP